LRELESRFQTRFTDARAVAGQAVAAAAEKLEGFNIHSLRRDRALDDLFGVGGDAGGDELALELSDADCDEAFAALAE
jgi:hypothetical protein